MTAGEGSMIHGGERERERVRTGACGRVQRVPAGYQRGRIRGSAPVGGETSPAQLSLFVFLSSSCCLLTVRYCCETQTSRFTREKSNIAFFFRLNANLRNNREKAEESGPRVRNHLEENTRDIVVNRESDSTHDGDEIFGLERTGERLM